jgi:hypothetical protein
MMLTYLPIRPLPVMHFFFPGRLHGYYSATPDPYPLQSFTTLVRKVCQHAVKPGNQLNLVRRWINIEPDNPHPLHCAMTKRHQKRKSVFSSGDNAGVSMPFPDRHVSTREFLLTTAEAGPSSIAITRHTTTTYKHQPQPAFIDNIPTNHLDEDERPTQADGTQVSII